MRTITVARGRLPLLDGGMGTSRLGKSGFCRIPRRAGAGSVVLRFVETGVVRTVTRLSFPLGDAPSADGSAMDVLSPMSPGVASAAASCCGNDADADFLNRSFGSHFRETA